MSLNENHFFSGTGRFALSTEPEISDFLQGLGVYCLSTALPYPAPNQVNSYLIEGNGLLVIDPGFNSDETWTDLERRYSRLGYSFADVKRIYLTHGHLDHYGITRRIQDLSGAQVFIHGADYHKVLPASEEKEQKVREVYRDYLGKAGLSTELIDNLFMISQALKHYPLPLEEVITVEEGHTIEWGKVTLKTMNVPGHTRGMVNYYDSRNKILFSGDHILSDISPNALPEIEAEVHGPSDLSEADRSEEGFPRWRSLIQYLSSIQRIFELDLDLVLPGHGGPIVDHRKLIFELVKFYQDRQNLLLEILEGGEYSPFQVVEKMFPALPTFEILLAISEVVGNAEVLEEQGKLFRVIRNNTIYYQKAAGDSRPVSG